MTTEPPLGPPTPESAMKETEDDTLVFAVEVKAKKHQIKQAVKKLSDIGMAKVNTQIKPNGKAVACV